MDLKPGDRVRTADGKPGRVVSTDGKYVVVAEDDGYSWRGRADDCVKMAASVHVPEREESTMAQPEKMDLTEVCVEPDGAVEVCVDEDGDEAEEILTYERAVGCPYCSKQVAIFGRALGDHRALGGVCPGAGRAVARVETGRAVLSTFTWSDDLVRRCAEALRKSPEQIRAMPWHALRDALTISNNENLAGEVVKTK